jgi:hypothetical protein
MSAPGLDLLVFRDRQCFLNGTAAKSALAQRLRLLETRFYHTEALTALLEAGELECALADSVAPTTQFQTLTDNLATALVDRTPVLDVKHLLAILDAISLPSQLSASAPEGFAFYGLHPLAFAAAIGEFSSLPPRVTVVGIRSIGTTLSAVTLAALRSRRLKAARITVRPIGHPYNRQTKLSPEARAFVRDEIGQSGRFLIVDEGPGLSGSSLLSVAEALVGAGVASEKITLLCTRAPDVDRLCAEDAGRRWRRFGSRVVSSPSPRPGPAQLWIGSGEWRRYMLDSGSEWPSSWLNFERLKYLSAPCPDPTLYKFAGFGRYGEEVLQREEKIASAGHGLLPKRENDGYLSYPWLEARPLSASHLSREVMMHLACYCAFRLRAFMAAGADVAPLQQMAEHDLHGLKLDLAVNLRLERVVIPDARMQPHEWLVTGEGRILKTDGGSHGDDHFFPGASDIAWDLAGVIVEWQMNLQQAEAFLEMYHHASGDDARARTTDYIRAYTAFRWAYCKMAANALSGTEEQDRLERAAAAYGAKVSRLNGVQ